MDAVGAHDDVGLDLRAVGKARGRDVTVRPHLRAPPAQMYQARRQRARESVEQIGPVHGRTLDAERGRLLLPARLPDDPARLPIAHDLPLRPPAHLADLVFYADGAQHPHRVGVQGHARPDLFELGGRLVDRHLDARPRQRVRRGQPADASPDDRDTRHGSLPGERSSAGS